MLLFHIGKRRSNEPEIIEIITKDMIRKLK